LSAERRMRAVVFRIFGVKHEKRVNGKKEIGRGGRVEFFSPTPAT